MKIKVAIVHYHPLEAYPPVMNDILDSLKVGGLKLSVYSTASMDEWFKPEGVTFHRLGFVNTHRPFYRYLTYLNFNLITFLKLLFSRPSFIIVYESLSLLPAFLIKLIWRDKKVHLHFHEYTSQDEIDKSSNYFKLLIALEKKMSFMKNFTLSHTNEDRVGLYLKDHPQLDEQKLFIFPNYPPQHWYEYTQSNKKTKSNSVPLRLIHVGALGLDTTYIKEIIHWVIDANGAYELDFYLSNISEDTQSFLDNVSSNYSFINIFPKVKYYDLPEILMEYDIGLVLYTGSIPNYIYNVPNKVMEYLACGLGVWYSDKLVSTTKFVSEFSLASCQPIDFENISIKDNVNCSNNNETSALFKKLSKSKIKLMLFD